MTAFLLALSLLAARSDDTFLAWTVQPVSVQVLPQSVATPLSRAELDMLAAGSPTLPFAEATVGLRTAGGDTWVGSPHGLELLPKGGTRWQVFHSQRWLPSDDVQQLSLAEDGALFVRTAAGTVKLTQQETSLEAKMLAIDEMLQKYHVRGGFVSEISLPSPGDLSTARMQESNDNDGLWTAMYLAGEAFRYAVTGDPQAKRNARQSLEALMFLERVSTIPGFVARSVIPSTSDPKRHGGEWHPSADGKWWWKADTSSDEVVGHYFAYHVYYNVAADEAERAEIRGYVERITDHILDHGLHYVGPPGKPTTWGVWSPEGLNHDLRRIGDRGLNSLEILSHLKVAEQIVGKPRYTEMLNELIRKHAYATNTVLQKQVWPPHLVNHSDDELAFLSYYPLVVLERDVHLRKVYRASIRRSWYVERPEHSPLFNYIYAAALQADTWTDPSKRPDRAYVDPQQYDAAESVEWFRDIPSDTIVWSVKNSHRRDVNLVGDNRERRARSDTVLPASERRVMRWNGDPYTLDGGGGGRERDDGHAILLPYWMGRYHRFVD